MELWSSKLLGNFASAHDAVVLRASETSAPIRWFRDTFPRWEGSAKAHQSSNTKPRSLRDLQRCSHLMGTSGITNPNVDGTFPSCLLLQTQRWWRTFSTTPRVAKRCLHEGRTIFSTMQRDRRCIFAHLPNSKMRDALLAHDSKILHLFCNHFTRAHRIQCVLASRENVCRATLLHYSLVDKKSKYVRRTNCRCTFQSWMRTKNTTSSRKPSHVNVFQLKPNIFLRTMKHNDETVWTLELLACIPVGKTGNALALTRLWCSRFNCSWTLTKILSETHNTNSSSKVFSAKEQRFLHCSVVSWSSFLKLFHGRHMKYNLVCSGLNEPWNSGTWCRMSAFPRCGKKKTNLISTRKDVAWHAFFDKTREIRQKCGCTEVVSLDAASWLWFVLALFKEVLCEPCLCVVPHIRFCLANNGLAKPSFSPTFCSTSFSPPFPSIFTSVLVRHGWAAIIFENGGSVLHRGDGRSLEWPEAETALFVLKKTASEATKIPGLPFYVCSFSSRVVNYMGMLTCPGFMRYVLDLQEDDFESTVTLVHSRFSTKTFPAWCGVSWSSASLLRLPTGPRSSFLFVVGRLMNLRIHKGWAAQVIKNLSRHKLVNWRIQTSKACIHFSNPECFTVLSSKHPSTSLASYLPGCNLFHRLLSWCDDTSPPSTAHVHRAKFLTFVGGPSLSVSLSLSLSSFSPPNDLIFSYPLQALT